MIWCGAVMLTPGVVGRHEHQRVAVALAGQHAVEVGVTGVGDEGLVAVDDDLVVRRPTVVVIARRSEPTSGSVSASAPMASRLATFGSQVSRTASEPWSRRRSCRCPAWRTSSPGGRSRSERLADDGDRQRVDRLVTGRRSAPATTTSTSPDAASRWRMSGSNRSASSARAATSAQAAASGRASACSSRYFAAARTAGRSSVSPLRTHRHRLEEGHAAPRGRAEPVARRRHCYL